MTDDSHHEFNTPPYTRPPIPPFEGPFQAFAETAHNRLRAEHLQFLERFAADPANESVLLEHLKQEPIIKTQVEVNSPTLGIITGEIMLVVNDLFTITRTDVPYMDVVSVSMNEVTKMTHALVGWRPIEEG